ASQHRSRSRLSFDFGMLPPLPPVLRGKDPQTVSAVLRRNRQEELPERMCDGRTGRARNTGGNRAPAAGGHRKRSHGYFLSCIGGCPRQMDLVPVRGQRGAVEAAPGVDIEIPKAVAVFANHDLYLPQCLRTPLGPSYYQKFVLETDCGWRANAFF